MKLALGLFLLLFAPCAFAFQSVVILPFNNQSEKQEIYWLGEGFAESLSEELSLQNAYIIQRAERKSAYEDMRLPYIGNLSRATMLKIGERLSANYVIFGSYNLKGSNLTADVQVVRLPSAQLSKPIHTVGSLQRLYDVQSALRESLKKYFATQHLAPVTEAAFQSGPVPLYAYEFYIKGLLEEADTERIKFFQKAINANPRYSQAIFRMASSLSALQRYRESNDYLKRGSFSGLIETRAKFLEALNNYFLHDYDAAYQGWLDLSKTNQTPEIYGNIGIALMKKLDFQNSGWYLSKAAELRLQNSSYRFNLAASYVQRAYDQYAVQQYREVIRLLPGDYQALYLLGKLLEKQKNPLSKDVLDLYRETLPENQKGKFPEQYGNGLDLLRPAMLFLSNEERQYLDAAMAQTLKLRSQYVKTYQSNARRLLDDGDPANAILEVRKATALSPFDWYLHYLWGAALAQQQRGSEALTQLNFSIWCQDNVDSHLQLAELYSEAEKYADAKAQVQKSLALDPKNKRAMDIWNRIWEKQ